MEFPELKLSILGRVAGIATLIVVSSLVTGCSGGAPAPKSGPVTLSQSWWGGTTRAPLQQAVIDLYEKANPQVTITQQSSDFTAYWNRLAVQASSNNLPDVTGMQDRYVVKFASSLLDLEPYIKDGTIDVSGISPTVLAAGKVGNKQVMIPSSFSYRGVEYDGAVFKAAGVPEPTAEMTWDALATNLQKLAKSGTLPSGEYAATNQCSNDSPFYSYMKSYGTDVFAGGKPSFTAQEAAAYFTYWQNLQQAGVLPPPAFQAANEGTTIEDTMFTKGMTALQMVPGNQFAAQSSRGGQIGLAGLPVGPDGAGNRLIVSGQSVGANSKNPLAAARFINFFVNDTKAALVYKADNGIPSAEKARTAIAPLNIKAASFYDTIVSNFAIFTPLPDVSSRVNDSLKRACDQVAFGRATPEQAGATILAELKAP